MRVTRLLTLSIALFTPALLCADDTADGRERGIGAEDLAAIERCLELSQAESLFYAGLTAGFDAGMDPENNPLLANIPPKKLRMMTLRLPRGKSATFSANRLKPPSRMT